MTVWYSDHFGSDGDNDTSIASPGKVTPASINHGRIYYKRAMITGMPLNSSSDVLRFFSMMSGDRLLELMISSDGGSSGGAMDIGLYLSGTAHDGAVVDQDLFETATVISTAIERTDVLAAGTVLQHEDHGKTLWALATVGALSLTADPLVNYDVCGTVTTSFTTTDAILVLEAYYTSSGG